jgi:uncharacterized heparinase superfamily protein
VLQLDCGGIPQGEFARRAHAGFLAFEFSTGAGRVVVNCGGASEEQDRGWEEALRATAAHSTLTIADKSAAAPLPAGLARDLLGPRLTGGPVQLPNRRSETASGCMVEASHDAYVAEFGLVHERKIMLSNHGMTVTGADKLVSAGSAASAELPFTVRFHIHPDVRVSRLEGGGFMLKLPGGEGWRFRAGGGEADVEVSVEESIYLGGGVVRRTEQLMISGVTRNPPAEIAWVFEQIVA